MRAIRVILAALLALTAVVYMGNGLYERISGRNEGPQIVCPEEILEISIHDGREILLTGVTARDAQDGDLTDQVIVGGVSRLIGGKTAKVTCMVFDSDDNMASVVRQVRYTDYRRPVIQLTGPLVYESTKEAKLLSSVTVTDLVDGDLSDQARVSNLWGTEDERVYSATIMVSNSLGDTATVDVPVIIGTEAGAIRLRRQILYLRQGDSFDPMEQLRTGTAGVTVSHEVDTQVPGCYWVWYTGTDGDLAILTVVVE